MNFLEKNIKSEPLVVDKELDAAHRHFQEEMGVQEDIKTINKRYIETMSKDPIVTTRMEWIPDGESEIFNIYINAEGLRFETIKDYLKELGYEVGSGIYISTDKNKYNNFHGFAYEKALERAIEIQKKLADPDYLKELFMAFSEYDDMKTAATDSKEGGVSSDSDYESSMEHARMYLDRKVKDIVTSFSR